MKDLTWQFLIGRCDVLYSVIQAGVFTEGVLLELANVMDELKRRKRKALIDFKKAQKSLNKFQISS